MSDADKLRSLVGWCDEHQLGVFNIAPERVTSADLRRIADKLDALRSENYSKLLDEFEAAVSRHRAANANFSRCSPGEIENAVAELKAARQALEGQVKG